MKVAWAVCGLAPLAIILQAGSDVFIYPWSEMGKRWPSPKRYQFKCQLWQQTLDMVFRCVWYVPTAHTNLITLHRWGESHDLMELPRVGRFQWILILWYKMQYGSQMASHWSNCNLSRKYSAAFIWQSNMLEISMIRSLCHDIWVYLWQDLQSADG